MYRGPLWSETISQAAPTVCMKSPTSDAKSANNRSRKTRFFSGRHGPDLPCSANRRVLLRYSDPVHSPHERPKRGRNDDRAIRLLAVLENRDQGAADCEAGSVEGGRKPCFPRAVLAGANGR